MYWNNASTTVSDKAEEINTNMRCIEMRIIYIIHTYTHMINTNMRCIEMCDHGGDRRPLDRLTLTWDVLKF